MEEEEDVDEDQEEIDEEAYIPVSTVPELELFSCDEIQTSITNTYDYTCTPLQQYTASSPIMFEVSGSSTLFTDSEMYMSVDAQILNADGILIDNLFVSRDHLIYVYRH